MLDQVKNKLFKLYLKFKYRPVRIKKHIRKSNKYKYKSRIMKENNFIYKESDIKMDENGRNSRCDERVTVAALQVKMELYDDPFKFADKMEELVVAACKKGAQLLVFPEDNLTQLLGLLPGIGVNDNGDIKADYEQSKINRSVNENIGGVINERDNEELEDSSSDINGLLSELGDDISVADILAYIGPIIRKISLAIFSELASKYGLYIMSGSGLFPEAIRDGKKADQQNDQNTVYNMAYLFGPDGSLLGRQKKNHLLPMEADWGLSTGEELSVIPTQIGRLAFPV
ncbi:MAG: nitrilase-related carbon-nitrogen hydrolase, partial [Halanaerobiales bacterium]